MLWIVVLIIVLFAVVGVGLYNGLVRVRNRVDAAWAQVDVQLERRYDLIPNLVETVKGYAAHERTTLDAVVRARGQAMQAQGPMSKAEADNALTETLKSLFALAEAYPDLKANQNFLGLQEELTATEGRVAFARQFYNDSVLRLNTRIETFPSSVFARIFGFTVRDYFEVPTEAQREAPQVRF